MSPEVLVVEDNASLGRLLHRFLSRAGFVVRLASDDDEAVQVYAEHKDRIRAVLVDTEAETFDCQRVVRLLRQQDPSLRVIAIGEGGKKPRGALLFRKPFGNLKQFAEFVHAACGQPGD